MVIFLLLLMSRSLGKPTIGKTNNLGFRPGPKQTSMYSHRSRLEARNFGFKKKSDCTICLAKTKALISFAVTAKLVCTFVFAYTDCWFSDAAAHFDIDTDLNVKKASYSLLFVFCII